ncbi:hypothetical protein C2G38_2249793 [Gigaspora rosea]|uniref:BTB domain-containing protein n=1 Tax=Gigaspora rosea TaxID=44941 RepID=A0A397URW2_9GLOM|nr:hypothetical protein C2G38_2249793 [Gigaspora rosea]
MITEFFKKLSNDLTNLLENGEDYNVLIEVGQAPNHQIFKVHSIILNSRCTYFRNELVKATYDENNIKNLSISHIPTIVFEIIIKYIYGGIVPFDEIDASTILDLLITSNEFGFEELVNTVQSQMVENHASWIRRNFSKIYKLSFENNNFNVLQKFCNDIIAKHPSIIFDSEDFTNLSEKALVSLIKLDNLQMDEGKIWEYVIRWGIAQNPDLSPNHARLSGAEFLTLKATLENCLPHIRYFQITGEDILEKVQPYHQILEPELWKDIMAKFMTPKKAITSVILPPRVVSTNALPPRNTSTTIASRKYKLIFSKKHY